MEYRTHADFTGMKFYWDGNVISRFNKPIVQRSTKSRIYRNDGSRTFVSRAAYEAWFGPIPKGLVILHHDEWAPGHYLNAPWNLNMGTQQTNVIDCVSKGRGGVHPGCRTLTDAQAIEISQNGPLNIPQAKAVAENLPCEWRTVYRISRGETKIYQN